MVAEDQKVCIAIRSILNENFRNSDDCMVIKDVDVVATKILNEVSTRTRKDLNI